MDLFIYDACMHPRYMPTSLSDRLCLCGHTDRRGRGADVLHPSHYQRLVVFTLVLLNTLISTLAFILLLTPFQIFAPNVPICMITPTYNQEQSLYHLSFRLFYIKHLVSQSLNTATDAQSGVA